MISYSVTRQTQEIGIRMALGATTERVQLGVIARTMRLVLAGIAVGSIASRWRPAGGSQRCYSTPGLPILRRFAGTVLLLAAGGFDCGIHSGATGVADRSDDGAARELKSGLVDPLQAWTPAPCQKR